MSHRELAGLQAIAGNFDAVLCDIWGVLHDGATPHAGAVDALMQFRAGGGAVVLISNAPRPAKTVVAQLDAMRVPRAAWDGVVTSGDVTRYLLTERSVRCVNHIGPARDLGIFDDLGVDLVAGDEAEIVVCTGLFDDEVEEPQDYRTNLSRLAERRLPMICANPDRVVERGDKLVWCAGALADLYAEFGCEIIETGKPHGMIYDFAVANAAAVRRAPVENSRVLAIGDAIRTDMMGAAAFGIPSLFVMHGIHAAELGHPPAPAKLAELLEQLPAPPLGMMPRLVW